MNDNNQDLQDNNQPRYTESIQNNDFENLIATADKNMYKQKKRIHKLKK